MGSALDIDGGILVRKLAQELEQKLEMPPWAVYVKTGVSRERQPESETWWYVRAASVLRQLYRHSPVGVARLRSYYGGSKNRGHKPSHFRKGSGKVIRTVLQQLEQAGYVQKATNKKGRLLSSDGRKFVDGVAKSLR